MLKKVLWRDDHPINDTLDSIMDNLRNDDAKAGLMYDAPTLDDVLSAATQITLDGIVVNYVRLKMKMLAMRRVMNAVANDEQKIDDEPIISDPFMRNGTAQVAVLFVLLLCQGWGY